MVRRMLNVSEMLPVSERIEVLDKFSQRMSNSGYPLDQIRRTVIGGLSGYEKKVRQSQMERGKGWRQLHERAQASAGSRWKKKLLGKSTWYKEKEKGNEDMIDKTRDLDKNIQKTKIERRKEDAKLRKKRKKEDRRKESETAEQRRHREMETTSVMFVDSTPFGDLTRRLQECEDKLGAITGRRVRMVEMSGNQLGQLLPNTNPWAGEKCGRDNCHPCNQGGDREKKEDCFRRNILYESRCGVCEDKNGGEKKAKRLKVGESLPEKNVYVGETSRTLFERCQEHIRDGRAGAEESHIARHWEEHHSDESMPEFRFTIVRKFKDPLSRQVSESVRIDLRTEVLNNKSVYSRNRVPRMTIEKNDWEMRQELRQREQEDRERQEKRKRRNGDTEAGDSPGQEHLLEETEEVLADMKESWRKTGIRRQEQDDREEKRDAPRAKRKKRKDRREEEEIDWGLNDLVEENGDIRNWLRDTARTKMETVEIETEKRQTRLKTWNWLELEAREIVVELARTIERQAEE